jgi:hypothetical protein
MTDNSPRSPDRKLGLIAPISIAAVAGLIILGAVFLQRRAEPAPPESPPAPAPAPSTPALAPAPTVTLEDAIVGRETLLQEAEAAAARYAAGEAEAPVARAPLSNRRFRLTIPFGCEGPQPRPGSAQTFYEMDPESRSIRLVARPAVWTTLPLIQQMKAAEVETVEGFWIPRPWSPSEGCPQRQDTEVPAAPTPPAAHTLGLAMLFEQGASRVAQRGRRPYEHVLKLGEKEQAPLEEGYRLVLEGRFTTFPSGRAVRCWGESPDHRPICLFAIKLERVAFESGGDGRLLAEWTE